VLLGQKAISIVAFTVFKINRVNSVEYLIIYLLNLLIVGPAVL
jgi:hypothetical protein